MSVVIKVDQVSKIYQLGQIGTGTLASDLASAWAGITGKDDPNKKIDDESDKSTHVALRDVSFDVNRGEVLGIIGKNGAGKSTMLKILSRITSPTSGSIKIKGRIASLLEVGTGFHPELSGRDNVFLNGAILGMTKAEVNRKFDEIVDFSGVEKFIDTPVKRYSSGMYVRLAFAVAAHLEPEILIVDEVLSVGDAEFQKKCLGKIKDVSTGDGRTVLFVSHNMEAVKNLCNRVVLLEKGGVIDIGSPATTVNAYFKRNTNYFGHVKYSATNAPGNETIILLSADLKINGGDILEIDKGVAINFEFELRQSFDEFNYSLNMFAITGEHIFNSQSASFKAEKGILKASCIIPPNLMNNGDYSISILAVNKGSMPLFNFENVLQFEIFDNRKDGKWFGEIGGAVRPKLDWIL